LTAGYRGRSIFPPWLRPTTRAPSLGLRRQHRAFTTRTRSRIRLNGLLTLVLERETGVPRAGGTYSAVEVRYRLDRAASA